MTLLPEQNFNAFLRLFDDRGDTLVPSANTSNDGAINVLTYQGVIPGRAYFICVKERAQANTRVSEATNFVLNLSSRAKWRKTTR